MINRVNHCPNCGKNGVELCPPNGDRWELLSSLKPYANFRLQCAFCEDELPAAATMGTVHSFLVKLMNEDDLYRDALPNSFWDPAPLVTDDSLYLETNRHLLEYAFETVVRYLSMQRFRVRMTYVADSPALRSLIVAARATSVDNVGSDFVVVPRDVFNVEYHFNQVHVGQHLAS